MSEQLYKIRYRHAVSGICLLRNIPESQLEAKIAELEADDKIIKIEHYEETDVAPTSSRDSKPANEVIAEVEKQNRILYPDARPTELVAPTFSRIPVSSPYFAKPYSIQQIDILDKVQIANFALHILNDPSEGPFPPIMEQTLEQLSACTEFYKTMFDASMAQLRHARRKAGVVAVTEIREDGERKKKEKVVKKEKALKPKSDSAKDILKASNEAKKLGGSPKHKKLLAFVVSMSLDIPNYTTMSEDELQKAVNAAMLG